MKTFGTIMAVLMVLIFTPIMYGFVFSKLWLWFVVPTFGLQELSIIQAIGLTYIVSFFLGNNDLFKTANKKTDDKESEESLLIKLIFLPHIYSGLVLFFGWLISLFM